MFPFPLLACWGCAQQPLGLPPPATSLWRAGQLWSTTGVLQMGTHVLARMPAMALGSGQSVRNGPHPHAIGSFSPHPRGRPGSSLPTTTRQSCQACGHRGGSELAVVGGNSQIQDGAGGARPRQCPYPELSSPRFQVDVCVRESCQGDLLVFSLLSSHLSGTRSCVSCRVPPSCTGSGLGRTRGGRRERGRNKGVGGRPWKDKED